MDTIIQALLSWQFLAFSLAIGVVVFVIRQISEYAMSNWWPFKQWNACNKEAKLWRELILPILPVALGVVGALVAKSYPFPEGFTGTSGRVVCGLVSGFTSGLAVRLYKSFLSATVADYSSRISSALKSKRDNDKRDDHDHDDHDDPGASVRDTINKDQ